MENNDLYLRKIESKIEKIESQIFELRMRSANSAYDVSEAFPQKMEALEAKLAMLKEKANQMRSTKENDTMSQLREEVQNLTESISTKMRELISD